MCPSVQLDSYLASLGGGHFDQQRIRHILRGGVLARFSEAESVDERRVDTGDLAHLFLPSFDQCEMSLLFSDPKYAGWENTFQLEQSSAAFVPLRDRQITGGEYLRQHFTKKDR